MTESVHLWSDDVTDGFVHPLTGELIEATVENLDKAVKEGYEEIARIRKALYPIEDERKRAT